jgi:hypothetical protein
MSRGMQLCAVVTRSAWSSFDSIRPKTSCRRASSWPIRSRKVAEFAASRCRMIS